MSRLSDELDRRYLVRMTRLRQAVATQLNGLYGRLVDSADIDASFARFAPLGASLLAGAQSQGVQMATAYLATLINLESRRLVSLPNGMELVGSTVKGEPLIKGMAPLPSMVKGQIGQGRSVSEAVDYGRSLVERFGTNEVINTVDQHTERVTSGSGEFTGWMGLVSSEACDPCLANEGLHRLDEPIYRHGSCKCTKQFVVRT